MKRRPLMVIRPRDARRKAPARGPWTIALLLGVLFAYPAFFVLVGLTARYPLTGSAEKPSGLAGAFHVHSTRSDGRGTPEQIAEAAAAAGLRFVVLTDHNPTELPPPKFHAGVLVIHGSELSTPAGHVIAVGISRAVTQAERERDVFGAVAQLGGRAFIAHPEQRKRPWTDWRSAGGAAGIELYSADTMFRMAVDRPLSVLLPAAAAYLANPLHGLMTIVRDQPALTGRALELNRQRPFVTLCSHDAHGLPAYDETFRTLGMYLPSTGGEPALPSDPSVAARQVLDGLAQGSAWCVFHAIAPAGAFSITGVVDPERQSFVGERVAVRLPSSAPREIAIRVRGPATLLPDGRTVRLDAPGAVHLEVWARVPAMFFQDSWKPWIVPSPIRVISRPAPGSDSVPVRDATVRGAPASAPPLPEYGHGGR